MVYLVEAFFSIQGEGRHAGVPSIFLRFGGCNLRCPGFGEYTIDREQVRGCDTLRAVDRKRFGRGWRRCERATDLIAVVRDYLDALEYRPHVVLTGGEPMLFHDDPAFYGLVGWLVREGFVVTVETNATIAPDFDRYRAYREVTFAMSVKLANSGEPLQRRYVRQAVAALAREGRDSFFKFVVEAEGIASGETEREIETITDGFPNEIYCMPLGETRRTLECHAEAAAKLAMRKGWRYAERLHIRLWDDEEGR